jgi:voltage-gated potassium channel
MRRILEFLFSPTYFYADFRKRALRTQGEEAIGNLIRSYNTRYLALSMLFSFVLGSTYQWNVYGSEYETAYIVIVCLFIWLFPLSRANEVFYAFLRDAIEKVNNESSHSNLLLGERIKLALKSYAELILDFAMIYYLLPVQWFTKPLSSIWDAIYFSGVTITTLGYGDYSPINAIPKLLTVYEVLCGFILLVVSFAIYTGRGLGEPNS